VTAEVVEPSSNGARRQPRPINEETLELVRRRIGVPIRSRQQSHNEECTSDSFRHFAQGYGDDNPLYCDPKYGPSTNWGSVIAPPLYPISAGVHGDSNWTAVQKATMSGGDPLAGINQYMCGERWLFLAPIHPNSYLVRNQSLHSATLKTSGSNSSAGILASHEISWRDEKESTVALRYIDYWHSSRTKVSRSESRSEFERTVYSDAELDEIDSCYENEFVLGHKRRLISGVTLGESLGPIVKGPLCVADIISYHTAIGWSGFGGGTSKIAYKTRRRIPKFYNRNEFGFWDTSQRCHWEDDYAQQLGKPTAYDYGAMRTNWMVNLITNWMGDDAWLWKLSAYVHKFNYMGDVHFISGEVTSIDFANSTVDIEIAGTNQRGEITCVGSACVVLPSATDPVVQVPTFTEGDVLEAKAP
jgi:hypothetical protein